MAAECESKITPIVNGGKPSKIKAVNGLTKKVAGDVFDEWKTLAGHSFTVGFVVESLRSNDEVYKKLHADRPIKDVTASDVSKGKGFVSEVLRCIIHFVDSTSESDTYTTILKIPGMESFEAVNENMTTKFPLDEKFVEKILCFHQTEVDFYEHLAKTVDIPVPRVFKTLPWNVGEAEGLLHMEDMTGKGISLEMHDFLTIRQIKEVVKYLAHMHRMVLTSEDKEFNFWKSKHSKNLYSFVSFCKMFDNPEPFLEICGDRSTFEPLINKCHKLGANPAYIEYAFSQSWKDLNMLPVIVHGDFHSGNMMWKLDKNNEATNEVFAFFDWQLSHEGSPMADLARILTLCADGCTRREAEEFIFDFYLEQLAKEMKEVGKEVPYTLDQIKKAYNYMYLTQAYGLIMISSYIVEMFKNDSPRLKQAKVSMVFLKCKHALEDMEMLLDGEMKDIYDKYRQ